MTIDISLAGSRLPPLPRPPVAVRPAPTLWHVQFGAGDVRVLSDQELQDSYRLTMISDYTHVWREGMGPWQLLGTILGTLRADAPRYGYGMLASASTAAQQATDHYASEQYAAQQYAAEQQYAAQQLAEQQYAAQQQAERQYAAQQLAEQQYAAQQQAERQYAAQQQAERQFAAQQQAERQYTPDYFLAAPASVQPLTVAASADVTTLGKRSRKARFGTWLLSAAFLGGAVVTAYRNDVFFSALRSVGYETRYLALEQGSVGAPGFGTPRAAAHLIDDGLSTVGAPAAQDPARASAVTVRSATASGSSASNASVRTAQADLVASNSSSEGAVAGRLSAEGAAPSGSAPASVTARDATQRGAVHSLDELPVQAMPNVPAATPAPRPAARVPTASAPQFTQSAMPKPVQPLRTSALPAHVEAPKPKAETPKPKAETPKPKIAAEKPAPAKPAAPTGPRTAKEKLLDAIGGAIANQ